MSLEEAIATNTAALIDNTAAHRLLADVATAAAGKAPANAAKDPQKDETPSEEETSAEDNEAAEKKATAAAKRKAAADKKKAAAAKKVEPPELASIVSGTEIRTIAGGFLKGDDEEVRDKNKDNVLAALAHLGAGKLTELADDTERARLAGYIAYWSAGLEVDFEAIDEIIAAADGDGGEDGDDLLG